MIQKLLFTILFFCVITVGFSQVANQPNPLEVCDDDGDGFAFFDLEALTPQVLGSQSSADFTVTYHETQSSADNGFIALSSPYFSYTNPQTIFIRVQENSSGSYVVISTNLITIPGFPPNSITVNITTQVCDPNQKVSVNAIGTANYEFRINNGSFQQNSPSDNSFLFENLTPGTHSVTVRNVNGCGEITENVTIESCIDSDSDGVSDTQEDVNGNNILTDDDTDMDTIPNYLDSDDDGDNIPTNLEITTSNSLLPNYIYVDTDTDMIENYLDDDDDGDGVLTKNEDYNNNGNPFDDDTNMNSIPDYLESAVALSTKDFSVLKTKTSIYPNPVLDKLYISAHLTSNVKVSVYDILGNRVMSRFFLELQETIVLNVSKLEKGVYFVELNDTKSSLVKKIIME